MITHLLVTEDISTVAALTIKSKRMITIKKISNLLQKDLKNIKMGQLLKQATNINKKNEAYALFFV